MQAKGTQDVLLAGGGRGALGDAAVGGGEGDQVHRLRSSTWRRLRQVPPVAFAAIRMSISAS